jgi:hypothetical protein
LVWLGERKGERGGARTQAQISTSWVRVGREATEEQRRETMMIREDRRDSLSPLQKVVTSVFFFFDKCKHNILSSQVTSQSSEEDEITNRS